MGSVIDHIECPHCEHEAFSDFYYKTGEEYINCQNCGYHYSAQWQRDDNGKLITKDGTEDYSFDNCIMETNELKDPYGAFRIKHYNSEAFECGSLGSEGHYNGFKQTVLKTETVEYCSVSRFVDGEIKVEHVIDNGPKFDGAGFSEEDREAQ
jgi:Zn ribbon nucleic-acid-binding protein